MESQALAAAFGKFMVLLCVAADFEDLFLLKCISLYLALV